MLTFLDRVGYLFFMFILFLPVFWILGYSIAAFSEYRRQRYQNREQELFSLDVDRPPQEQSKESESQIREELNEESKKDARVHESKKKAA